MVLRVLDRLAQLCPAQAVFDFGRFGVALQSLFGKCPRQEFRIRPGQWAQESGQHLQLQVLGCQYQRHKNRNYPTHSFKD